MRSYHISSAVMAFVAVGLAHGQTFSLHRQFHAGEVDKYSCAMKVSQQIGGMGGSMPMGFSGDEDMTFKVQKLLPATHSAQVEITTVTKKMDFGSMSGLMGGQESKIPKVVHMNGTMDSHNRFVTTGVDNAMIGSFMGATGSMGQSSGMMIELPDHPVKVGDSWDMQFAQMKAMGITGKPLKVTLVGTGQVHGHPVLKVKISGKVPMDMDAAKMLKAMSGAGGKSPLANMPSGMSMRITGTMSFSGMGEVDAKTGKTVSLDSGIGTDMTINIGGMQSGGGSPMAMKSSGTTTMKIRLAGY